MVLSLSICDCGFFVRAVGVYLLATKRSLVALLQGTLHEGDLADSAVAQRDSLRSQALE